MAIPVITVMLLTWALAEWTSRSLSLRYLWSAAGFALLPALAYVAMVFWAQGLTSWLDPILLSQGSIDRAYHDTYYVIANYQMLFLPAACCAALALIARVSGIGSGLKADRWIWRATLFALTLAPLIPGFFIARYGMPRRSIDVPDTFEILNRVTLAASLLAFALIALALIRCLRFWLRSRNAA